MRIYKIKKIKIHKFPKYSIENENNRENVMLAIKIINELIGGLKKWITNK